MRVKNERGEFTLIELIIVVVGVGGIALAITGIWIAAHFIAKFW